MRSAKPFLILCTVIVNVGMSKEESCLTGHGDNGDNLVNIPVERTGAVEEGKSAKFVSVYLHAISFSEESGYLGNRFFLFEYGIQSLCQVEATSAKNMYFNTKDTKFYHKGKLFSEELKLEGYVCLVNIDYLEFYSKLKPPIRITMSDLSIAGGDLYQCEVRQSARCNSESICSTDECHCTNKGTEYHNQVMFCPRKDGGKACIAFDNVCDGIVDCADHSDECLCQDSYELFCDRIPQLKRLCLPKMKYCGYLPQIKELNCSNHPTNINCTEIMGYSYQTDRPFVECLYEIEFNIEKSETDFAQWVLKYVDSAKEKCITQCTNTTELEKWKSFCQNIDFERNSPHAMVLKCENDKVAYSNNSYPAGFLCDGKIHCLNSADELDCPGRFYCSVSKTVTWINESLVCDKNKDCFNGKDECSGCTTDSSGSFQFMVESKLITVLATLGGVVIMIINIFVGLKTLHENPISKAAQRDKILRLSLCFYDFQMGVYLISIIIASTVLMIKGDYCELDEDWRASVTCMMLGVIFSVSSHGSLVVIGIMSMLRCLQCSLGFSFELSTRNIWIVIVIIFLLSFIHSIVPILPIHQLQNFFRTSMILIAVDKNPFITSREGPDMIEQVQRIHSHYFNNSSSTDTIKLLADLRNANITSDNKIFDVADIGYYGNTPLCISNVFKVQGNYRTYTIVYCVVIALLLSAITASYIIIVVNTRSYRHKAGSANNNNTSQLTLKLSLMIISQLVSWVSFIATVIILTCAGKNPPAKMFEIFALLVIPINSLLNPIFYSSVYKNIISYLWTKGKKMNATGHYRVDNETELQIYNSNAIIGTLPHLQKGQPKSPEIAEHSDNVPLDDQPTFLAIAEHFKRVSPDDDSVPLDDQPISLAIAEHSKNVSPYDDSVPLDDQPTSLAIAEHSKSVSQDDDSVPLDDQPTFLAIAEHSKSISPDAKSVLLDDQPTSLAIAEHSKSVSQDDDSVPLDDQPTFLVIAEHSKSAFLQMPTVFS